ncbi:MAG: MoxR family ATPase [Candidatus Wallbacteria bacterium]
MSHISNNDESVETNDKNNGQESAGKILTPDESIETANWELNIEAEVKFFRENFKKVKGEIAKRIAGYEEILELILLTIFSGGHSLLEGVPGIGKTQLVKTVAEVFSLNFKRIQFTPDLMPSDVIGSHVLVEDDKGSKILKFNEGPVFCNVLLADEINRATPKTQSALLECMAESTVTVSNLKFKLDQPFFVLATENPIEMEGTFPLPEAQLDRFMTKINLDFPTADQLETIIDRFTVLTVPPVEMVMAKGDILRMQSLVKKIAVSNDVKKYAVNIIKRTHPDFVDAPQIVKKYLKYGSSPRGLISLILMAKAKAIISGRFNVSYDDLRYVAPAILNHRMILNFDGLAEGITPRSVVEQVIK